MPINELVGRPHPDVAPLVVEHYREEVTPSGFTPAARLLVTPALRTSGLLTILSDDAARTLLAVATFLTANGRITPAPEQVAEALGVSAKEAQERVKRLAALSFADAPLAYIVAHESGLETVHLSRAVVAEREALSPADESPIARYVPAGREAIIAHSRANYAHPRAEVEAQIAAFLGHHVDEMADTPEGEARRRLLALGVPTVEVNELVEGYPVERILDQIAWLSIREARNPARFVAAAIRGDYDPPRQVLLERELERIAEHASNASEREAGESALQDGENLPSFTDDAEDVTIEDIPVPPSVATASEEGE